MSYNDKLKKKDGPRKLLACDGGGIRGIISIEILAKIEAELRASSGKPKLVLADYFDYVAGTSTSAIIATLIALGKTVDQIREFYIKSGAEMFEKARLWERFKTKFRNDKLSAMLQKTRSITSRAHRAAIPTCPFGNSFGQARRPPLIFRRKSSGSSLMSSSSSTAG
jgi:predicted acylesterase/phospholipase RssA